MTTGTEPLRRPSSRRERAVLGRRPVLAALALGLTSVGAWAADTATEAPGAQRRPWPAGKPTPALNLPTLDGAAWNLADARGQVVVVNFWASWCEPCRAEMPSLELLAQRHERDKVQVVAVNFRETDGAIKRFVDQTSLSLPILRDSDGATARAWQVRIFPSTVVIGRNGRPAFTITGEVDWTGAVARGWMASVL